MQSITVRIIGKVGCHLCDDAERVVSAAVRRYSNVVIEHAVLDDNTEWESAYSDKIPVIHIDGVEVAYWRISDETLRGELDSRGAIALPVSPRE